MDKDYLYRIDTIRSLKSIQKEGYRCGAASRITQFGLKSETAQALENGLPVPPKVFHDKPWLYFFETLQHAEYELTCFTSYDFICRYSRARYPFSDDSMIYPDGAWRRGAVYVIFPDLAVDDIAVLPESIEIQVNNKWYQLNRFDFDSLDYVKCCHCRAHIQKNVIKKGEYKSNVWSEKFYCEACCRPIKSATNLV